MAQMGGFSRILEDRGAGWARTWSLGRKEGPCSSSEGRAGMVGREESGSDGDLGGHRRAGGVAAGMLLVTLVALSLPSGVVRVQATFSPSSSAGPCLANKSFPSHLPWAPGRRCARFRICLSGPSFPGDRYEKCDTDSSCRLRESRFTCVRTRHFVSGDCARFCCM